MTTYHRDELRPDDLRKNRTFMHFWDAINEGRAEAGLPEALFFSVRMAWDAAMLPTQAEKDLALREEQNREFFNVDADGYEDKF